MTKPIFVREDGSCGPAALTLIETMAREHKTIGSIAKALGISKRKLRTMFEKAKGENPEHLAYESGHADFEQQVTDIARGAALGVVIDEPVLDANGEQELNEDGSKKTEKVRVLSKAQSILLMYFTKTQLGWSEKGSAVSVQDNRINITLPAPISREEMFKRLGITAPLDFRRIKDVTPGSPGGIKIPLLEKKS